MSGRNGAIDWTARAEQLPDQAELLNYRDALPLRLAGEDDATYAARELAAWNARVEAYTAMQASLATHEEQRAQAALREGLVPATGSAGLPQFGRLTPEHVAYVAARCSRRWDIVIAMHLLASANVRTGVCVTTPTQLAAALHYDRSAVSKSLCRLCKLGLLERIEGGFKAYRWQGDPHSLHTSGEPV